MVFNWIDAHVRAYEYFGGVPKVTVSDNTKTAVIMPDLVDPVLNKGYHEMARHYRTTLVPASGRRSRAGFETAQPKGVTPNEENGLLEQVLERENMLQALHRVERNQGAPGNGVPL